MPYPNEHALRLKDPSSLSKKRVRRTKGSGESTVNGVKIPGSISVIWFIGEHEGKEVPVAQALRFPVSSWTKEKAQVWVKENKISGTFEEASKEDTCGTITVFRTDRIASRKIGSVKKTDEGYLTGVAPVAKVGVMSYFLSDGSIRRELVPEDTLFNVDSMNSLKMKPVTNSHPAERSVTSKNAGKRKVGYTGETIKRDGDFLTTSLTITDDSAVDGINSGREELSPGYACELLLQSGTLNGDAYDAIQIKRTYNHVALCDAARGGADIRLHLDSESADEINGFEIELDSEDYLDNENTDSTSNTKTKRSRFMATIHLDNIEYNADQQVINAYDKATNEIKTLKADNDTIQAKLDSANDELKKLKERNIDGEITTAVTKRISLQNEASAHLDEEIMKKIDSMSDSDIKVAVINKAFENANLDGKSDDYITARYDSALELLSKEKSKTDEKGKKMSDQRKKVNSNNTDSNTDSNALDQDKSRNDMIDRLKNGWKPKEEK